MAKELKVSGNYVIATDLILPNQILGQFPINHCVYRENDNSFIILEQIDNEVVTIDKAQVDAGEWVDEGSTPFTQATLLTFLRDNTGFNTAGGGSSALPYKVFSAKIVGQPTGVGTTPNISESYINTFDDEVTGVAVAGTGWIYLNNPSNEFTLGKTSVLVQQVNNVGYSNIVVQNSASFVQIRAFDDTGALVTSAFTVIVEIKVYP